MLEKRISKLDRKIDELRKRVKGVEDIRVGSEVFDKATLLTLYNLANRGIIDILYGVIKTGKEANIFKAKDRKGRYLAVKIHRVTTSNYKAMWRYIGGDERFKHVKKDRRGIVYAWVEKEFRNLKKAREVNVKAPRPVAYKNNVLIMEFIGKDEIPAPMLKNYTIKNPEKVFHKVIEFMKRLYCDGALVHTDLSEYNILMHNEKPVIIDLSHALLKTHPNAHEFLKRDVANIVRFFERYLDIDEKEIYEEITKC